MVKVIYSIIGLNSPESLAFSGVWRDVTEKCQWRIWVNKKSAKQQMIIRFWTHYIQWCFHAVLMSVALCSHPRSRIWVCHGKYCSVLILMWWSSNSKLDCSRNDYTVSYPLTPSLFQELIGSNDNELDLSLNKVKHLHPTRF